MEESLEMNNSLLMSNSCLDITDYYEQYTSDWTTFVGVRVIVGVVYALIFLIGVFGNAGVIIRVISDNKLHSAQYVFLVNLMASDFLLCLTSVPFSPVAIILKHWIFGGVLCRAIPLCQAMSVVITSLTLTLIAVDKYVHIIDATRPPVSLGQAFVAIGLIWTVACGISLPLVMSYGLGDGSAYYEEFGVFFCGSFCDESWQPEYKRVYGTSIMCVQFVVPMFIIAYCYSAIMRKVQRDMMIENKQFASSLSNGQRLEAISKKKKVTYILIMMVVAFIGSWAPLTSFNIFRDYSHLPEFVDRQPYFFALIVHCLAMSSVIWNPLLFFWLTGRRQKGSRKESTGDSTVISFLLAMNPVRAFKRRNRQADTDKCVVIGDRRGGIASSFGSTTLTPADDRPSKIMISDNFSSFQQTPGDYEPHDQSIIVNQLPKGPPLICTNGKKRLGPSNLEYRLLSDVKSKSGPSPRAPRVMAESFSDLSAFEMEEATGESGSSVDADEDIVSKGPKRTRMKGGKSLLYAHLRKNPQF